VRAALGWDGLRPGAQRERGSVRRSGPAARLRSTYIVRRTGAFCFRRGFGYALGVGRAARFCGAGAVG